MGGQQRRVRSVLLSLLLVVGASSCSSASRPSVRVGSGTHSEPASGSGGASSGTASCDDGGPVTASSGPKPVPSEIVHAKDPVNTLGGAELLPTGFPVPPGFSVGQVGRIANVSITGEILPGDVNAAYTYLLTALPAAGYRITGCGTSPAVASIMFVGHECTGPDTQVVLSYTESSVVCSLAS